MHDVAPLLSAERQDEAGGLWATKQYGDLKEGDRLRAADYVTGSVEVRELRSVYKLSFLDIVRVNRFKHDGQETMKHDVGSDDESSDSLARGKRAKKEQSSVRLYVFLTTKKAKARMADLEETAFLLRLDAGTDGCISFGKSYGDFDQGMLRVPNPTGFKGIVIAKRRADAPATEEPIVYAYAKLAHRRRPVVATEVVLGLAEDKDRARMPPPSNIETRCANDDDLLKGMRKYTRTARKAWEALSIPEDQEINFGGFKRAFDELDLVILEARALRLFQVCDLDGSGMIGISEMEVALMVHDVVPNNTYLTPLDSFHTFDLDGGGDISWAEFKVDRKLDGRPLLEEAAGMISRGRVTEQQARDLFEKVDADKSGVIEYDEFKQAWVEMIDLEQELKVRGLKPAFGPMTTLRNRRQLLKAVVDEDKAVIEAFETVRERVDNVRKRYRLLRDEKKKLKASKGHKSSLEDANQDATRRRQRRLMVKREQAERSRQRVEQKIKQNELRQQMAAKKERDIKQTKTRMVQQEKDRIAKIRARGDDQLCLSRLKLRQIPVEYCQSREWREKLVDLVLLDLEENRLSELPEDFLSQMLSLRKISLGNNRLTSLAEGHIANLGKLQILDLRRNELRDLPSSVGNLSKLQHLVISKNEICQLPEELGHLHELRSLCAHSNNLELLPASVGGLVSLELCDLSGNRLAALPNDFSYATALTRLDLSRNRLRYLPLDFGQLFSLQILDVSCNQLHGLPTTVSTLKSLQILKLGENSVVEVTEAWGGMSSLVELEAQANRIARVSPGIGGLVQLQRLDVSWNLIDELPSEIGFLTKLHELNLRSNHLTALPDEMGALVVLHRLDLAHNHLERRLSDHLGMLTRLTDLDLSSNRIGNIPPALGGLEDLEALNLSKNVLSTLPQNFAFLTNLTDLDLSCNHFKDFPTVLCGMTALRQLDVTSNVLTCLPSEVGALTMLNKLHLRHNLLRSLPLEMVELERQVKDLTVENNPLSVLPNKWHARFGRKEEASKPRGYTHGEVYEWLRAQRAFHCHATEEWEHKAGLYLTARASAHEFVDGVRARVGTEVWRPYLEPHVLRFFFRAKKIGLPDTCEKITPCEAQERQAVAAAIAAAREDQVRLCAADTKDKAARCASAYATGSARKLQDWSRIAFRRAGNCYPSC